MGILLITLHLEQGQSDEPDPLFGARRGDVVPDAALRSTCHRDRGLVAFAIPFGDGSRKSISARLQHFLHRPVSYAILPLFALANTGIILESHWFEHLLTLNGYGFLGPCGGQAIGGIGLFCLATIGLGVSTLPPGIGWKQLLGAAMLAGIGFTMSIFITMLAFVSRARGIIQDHDPWSLPLSQPSSGIHGCASCFPHQPSPKAVYERIS